MSSETKKKLICTVKGCPNEGFYWRIESPNMPNSTALNGQLCREHYNKILDIVRQLAVFSLTEKKQKLPNCPACGESLNQVKYNLFICDVCDAEYDAEDLGLEAEDFP